MTRILTRWIVDLKLDGFMFDAPDAELGAGVDGADHSKYALRVFPPCALVPRVQGSSGAVATVQFVWRGHAETPTSRAGPWPDFASRLE